MATKDNFSSQSDQYAKYRPTYPSDFFDYLNTICTNKQNAWDCGTGNGQVAYELAKTFNKVYATDISQSQIQINQEISNDFQEKKKLLAGLRPVIRTGNVGLRLKPSHSLDALPAIPSVTDRAAAVASDAVSDSADAAFATGCEQLAIDAAQTTLMVLEFQRWHAKQTQQMSFETGSDP